MYLTVSTHEKNKQDYLLLGRSNPFVDKMEEREGKTLKNFHCLIILADCKMNQLLARTLWLFFFLTEILM